MRLKLTSLLVLLFGFFTLNSYAQVNVGATPYTTLKAAFDAINVGTHTGAITITISGNTTETASAVLDSSGNGTGSNYTSVSIQPTGGATRTISGAIVGHLVVLNGADNVNINGLNTGGNALEFRNSGTGASSTIRFIADATNNTVTNCTITGSTTSFGVVYFATGSVNGNDGNIISNNNITAEGVNYPTACIYSLGTSSAIDNSGNTVSGNNIYDFFSASAVSNGMNLTTGSSGWTISNNKFYQTASRTYTTANTHNAITASVGTGYTVTGNTIGYATSGGTGTYTMLGTIATRFIGINLAISTGSTSSVQGNTVAAISLNTSSGATTTNGIICGINITGTGNVNIGNVTPNTIGATTGTNSIVGTSTTSGGLVVGINTSTTGTVLIQNNTFGAMASSGITATIAGSVAGINVSGVAASMTITGNTIGNGTTDNMRGGTTGLTTGNSLVTGIALVSIPTTCNVTNNTIQNLTSYGTGTTGRAMGVFNTGTTPGATVLNITGNTIFNILSNCTNTTFSNAQTGVQGIMHSSGTNGVVSGNTIYNLSNTNTGTSGYTVSGIGIGNGANTKVEKNIIYGLSNASTSTTTTTPGVCAGILVRSGTTSDTVVNNMITLGAGQTTNTSFVGILLNHGSTPDPVSNIFYNTVSISGTVGAGAQPSFAIARTDFSATARTAGVIIKNNIFDNSRTGGTGKHYAIANNYGAATSSATGWGAGVTDNNVLNSASSSTVGFWTTDQTLAGWRTASSCDASSITAVSITYTNSASGNLRLNMGVTATQLESGGTTISSVTTDIDGFARPKPGAVNGGGFAPDFGASEADMVPLDLTGPSITYTLIPGTSSLTNRTLTNFAAISDPSGVNTTAGTKPRIYYKKSTDANAFVGNTSADNGWKWFEASNASSPFSFVIDYSIIFGGSAVAGDVIQYFVVAQDLQGTPNVGSNPSAGFSATSVGAITSAPTTPNSYSIYLAPLSGTYTVGTTLFRPVGGGKLEFETRTRLVQRKVLAENDAASINTKTITDKTKLEKLPEYKESDFVYTTVEETYQVPMVNGKEYTGSLYHEFTKEEKIQLGLPDYLVGDYATIAAAILAYNTRGVSGPTVFSLTDASYSEGNLIINHIGDAPTTASNTLKIRPAAGVNVAITSTQASLPILKTIGLSYFTIDGNPFGAESLTITNNSATAPLGIHLSSSGTTAITQDTIKNLTTVCGLNSGTTLTAVGISISDQAAGGFSNGYGNGIVVSNCTMQKTMYGVLCSGGSVVGTANMTNISFIGNNLATSGANQIAYCGLAMQGTNGGLISQNTIANFENATGQDDRAIWLPTAAKNIVVERNNINSLGYVGTGGYGNYGVLVTTGETACNNIIRNNVIADLWGDGWTHLSVLGDNTHGVYATGTQTGIKIYNNSISLGRNTLNQTDALTTGICLGTGSTADIRNNSIVNNAGLSAATGYGSTCIYLQSGVSQLENSNYNNLYNNATGSGVKLVGKVATTNYATLALYKAATSLDGSSVSGDPAYTSATNLLPDITNSNSWTLNGNGVQGLVTNDYNGASRSTTVSGGAVDIGAYEFTPSATPPTATASGAPANSTTTTYTLNGRLLCSITWGAGGTVPTSVTFTYYPGVPPPGSIGYQVGNGYWVVTVPDGSGFSYDITFNYDDALLGTISPETDLRLSKSEDGGTTWNSFLVAGTGAGEYELNTTNNTIKVYGLTAFSTFGVSDNDVPLPVELASFTSYIDKRNVELKWSTSKEENNAGFDVERKLASENSWIKIGNVQGAGNSSVMKNYTLEDRNLSTGKYNYRLKQIDFNGNHKYFNLSNEVIVGIPSSFSISQNYPNPFNPSTRINYDLPFDSKVSIKLYDVTGKEVASIVNQAQTAGYYTVNFNASSLASGVYFYQINADGGSQKFAKTLKMMLVK
ncbi:MAG: T9SS type A sorting domain-containing protein [Ignavibacteria bacterium]|nr:T9SS type A sorting domain-containing protein [Ignavibacteria bacterium]